MSAEALRILMIESSGQCCGIALLSDGCLLSSYSHWTSNVHDRVLATMCQRVLQDNSLRVTDLNAVAISAGPGSFTGLRIGMSFVKALCVDEGPKLLCVPTLEAQARYAAGLIQFSAGSRFSVCIGAQRGKCYIQEFEAKGSALSEPQLVDNEQVLHNHDSSSMMIGPGAALLGLIDESHPLSRLHVEHLGPLSQHLYSNKAFHDPSAARPFYVQDFVPKTAPLHPLD